MPSRRAASTDSVATCISGLSGASIWTGMHSASASRARRWRSGAGSGALRCAAMPAPRRRPISGSCRSSSSAMVSLAFSACVTFGPGNIQSRLPACTVP